MGNWQPSAFSTSCITCREGHYCNTTAISDLTNFKCSAGQVCGTGLTANTGSDCPVNKFCEEGTVVAQDCQDGYQNSQLNQSACSECGDNQFCYQAGTAPSLTETITSCATNNTQ